jgi:hypothetical protein
MKKHPCKPSSKPWGAAYFTRGGKRYYARDYGYRCWPIGRRK